MTGLSMEQRVEQVRQALRRESLSPRVVAMFHSLLSDLLMEQIEAGHRLGVTVRVADMLDALTGWKGFGREYLAALHASGCPLCSTEESTAPCPFCGLMRCRLCVTRHDDASLCREIVRYAEMHCALRGGDEVDEHDQFFAVRAMVPTIIARSQQ